MFVEKMKEEEPDIIVIAGDLYDTTYPSKDAIMLLEQAIGKLNLELRIPIIMISEITMVREIKLWGELV